MCSVLSTRLTFGSRFDGSMIEMRHFRDRAGTCRISGSQPPCSLNLRLLRQQPIEHVAQEDFERSVALVSLRTQERTLPAVEQETGQRLGIRICGKFLLRNCLLDDRRDRVLPVPEAMR